MRPVVRASLATAAFAALLAAPVALGGSAGAPARPVVHARTLRLAASVRASERPVVSAKDPEKTELSAVCPAGELPDDDHCVRFAASLLGAKRPTVPREGPTAGEAAPNGGSAAPLGPVRRSTSLEQVPRKDDRPADLDAYTWPLAALSAAPRLGTETDGVGGVDLPVVGGEEVAVVKLANQKGQPTLFVIEPLDGATKGESWFRVVTHHVLQQPGEEPRDWLVFLGPLQRVRDDRTPGKVLASGDSLGVAAPGALHLEVREVREGLDLASLAGEGLRADDRARRVDPRNVFPLRSAW
jgi:hypothetical protein